MRCQQLARDLLGQIWAQLHQMKYPMVWYPMPVPHIMLPPVATGGFLWFRFKAGRILLQEQWQAYMSRRPSRARQRITPRWHRERT